MLAYWFACFLRFDVLTSVGFAFDWFSGLFYLVSMALVLCRVFCVVCLFWFMVFVVVCVFVLILVVCFDV